MGVSVHHFCAVILTPSMMSQYKFMVSIQMKLEKLEYPAKVNLFQ